MINILIYECIKKKKPHNIQIFAFTKSYDAQNLKLLPPPFFF